MTIILVALGGAAGSVCRYLMARSVAALFGGGWFPYGTLSVNIVGALIIGFLAGLADARGVLQGQSRILLFGGFLGGYTTFSAFGLETMTLAKDGHGGGAVLYVAATMIVGLGAVFAGNALGKGL